MSIVTNICVFFAANPDEELSASDIAAKWGVKFNNAKRSLQYAEAKGWLVCTRKPDKTSSTGKRNFFTAGPRLFKEIGLVRPDSGAAAQIQVDEAPAALLLDADAGEAQVERQA